MLLVEKMRGEDDDMNWNGINIKSKWLGYNTVLGKKANGLSPIFDNSTLHLYLALVLWRLRQDLVFNFYEGVHCVQEHE